MRRSVKAWGSRDIEKGASLILRLGCTCERKHTVACTQTQIATGKSVRDKRQRTRIQLGASDLLLEFGIDVTYEARHRNRFTRHMAAFLVMVLAIMASARPGDTYSLVRWLFVDWRLASNA